VQGGERRCSRKRLRSNYDTQSKIMSAPKAAQELINPRKMDVWTFHYQFRRSRPGFVSHAFGCLVPLLGAVFRFCADLHPRLPLLFNLVCARFVAARDFNRHPTAQLPQRLTLLAEGIRYESDRGVFTLLWKDVIKWRANGKLILAYLSPRLFLIYPARLATAGFPMDRLKEKLTEELGPAKG